MSSSLFPWAHVNLFKDLSLIDSDWGHSSTPSRPRGRVVDYEVPSKRPDGRIVVTSINASLEHDKPHEDGVIRGIMRDLTRNRELEQRSVIDERYLLSQVRHIRAGQGTFLRQGTGAGLRALCGCARLDKMIVNLGHSSD